MKKLLSKTLLLAFLSVFFVSQNSFAQYTQTQTFETNFQQSQSQQYLNPGYPELCSVFNRTLKVGDTGIDVKRLQVVLGQEGIAYLSSTGYFGNATMAAVKTFQTRNGIYPAGKVGPQTLRVMRAQWCNGYTSGGVDSTYIPINTNNPELPATGWNNGGSNWNYSGTPEVSLQPISSSANNITLSWNTRAVNSCSLQQDGGNFQNLQSSTGQQIFTLYGETRFTLKCIGSNGREYSKTILVRPNQAISSLPTLNVSINPSQILIGQQATLYWTSSNAAYCTSNVPNYTSNLQTSGSIPVTVSANSQSYTFTCYSQNGLSVTQTITANNTSASNLVPTINNFSYSNNYLAWGTSNANSCTLTGGNIYNQTVQTNGNYPVTNPNINTTWTLTCYGNTNQSVTRQVYYNTNTSGGNTNINNNFTLSLTTDKTNYNLNESVTFTLNVMNNTNSNLSYNEPICDPFYVFTIGGVSVFNTPQAQCLAFGSNLVTLVPGQNKIYTVTVPGNVSNITNSATNKNVTLRFYPTSNMGIIDIYQNIQVNVNTNTNTNSNGNISISNNSLNINSIQNITWNNTMYNNAQGAIIDLVADKDIYENGIKRYGANTIVGTVKRLPESNFNINSGNYSWTMPQSISNTQYNDAITCAMYNGAQHCGNIIYPGIYKIRITYFSPQNACFGFCQQIPGQQVLGISESSAFNVTGSSISGNVTVNISANPNPISGGQLTNLTWYSSNASYCNIVGGNTNLANQPANGSYAVSPAQSTNYTITCYNSNNQNASAYVYVTINGNGTGSNNTSLFITSNSNRNVNINVYKAPYNTCTPGYINWGDNTANTNYSYPTVAYGSSCQIGVTHVYTNVGTYTITAYENNVMAASTQITVQ